MTARDLLAALPARDAISDALTRLEQLEAIEQWALRQLPVGVGDRVALVGSPVSRRRTPGWWTYREVLVDGATAVVTGLRFGIVRGWEVEVMLDREWSVATLSMGGELRRWWNGPGEPPAGYHDGRRGLEDRRHTWSLGLDQVVRVP